VYRALWKLYMRGAQRLFERVNSPPLDAEAEARAEEAIKRMRGEDLEGTDLGLREEEIEMPVGQLAGRPTGRRGDGIG
jgi:hypothetical protein